MKFLEDSSKSNGVSAVIGVLILVVLVLLLTTGVYFTATNLTQNQPEDLTAGTTTERVSPYEYQSTLVTNGNANHIQVVSPLGTKYNLTEVGDSTKILAVEQNSNPKINRLQITAASSKGSSAQRQLLKSQTVDNGINADLIVDKYGTGDYKSIQTAIDNAPSATSNNPAVIVVEKATYTENIDVSQNITLIAEHGTVIQDAAPNEPVMKVSGDNSQVRNFQVNGDPKANDGHYASHGILVEGKNAQVIGNSLRNSSSPDLTSAGLTINDKNTFVKYNNFQRNEQSISLKSNAQSPLVCGNQFSNSIGGFVSDKTKQDLAMNNYWNNGIPASLVPDKVTKEVSQDSLLNTKELPASSNRVPVSFLPPESIAQQAFPGTQLSSNSEGASIEGCDVNVNFINNGGSFSLSDIRVLVNGEPLIVFKQSQQSQSGSQLARESGDKVAVCSCGGDGSYDAGDTISLYDPTTGTDSSSSSDGGNDNEVVEPHPISESDNTQVVVSNPDGSGGTTYTPIDSVEKVPSMSDTQQADSGSSGGTDSGGDSSTGDGSESSQGPSVELGSEITATTGDELVLQPVIDGDTENNTYAWDFDDGSTASVKVPEHIYTTAGTYNVSLTVTNTKSGQTATDSITIEIKEGKEEVRKIDSGTSEAASVLTNESASYGGSVYLEDGTYSVSEVTNKGLTIVGSGDNVVFENRMLVKASGVTFRNVEFSSGVSSTAGDLKLYNIDASSNSGYAVEIDTSESSIYLGSSTVSSPQGAFVNAENEVVLKDNQIEATGSASSAVKFGSRMDSVEVKSNSLTGGQYGLYIGHASSVTQSNNNFNAPTQIYRVKNKPLEIMNIRADALFAGVTSELAVDVTDVQGDAISNIVWYSNGEKIGTGSTIGTVFESSGDYTVTVQATDSLGLTNSSSTTFTVTQPTLSSSTTNKISVGDSLGVTLSSSLPVEKVNSVTYEWGDGSTTQSSSLTGESETHTYSETGDYTITITVQTNSGRELTTTSTTEVVQSPVARFDIEGELEYGNQLSFNASTSSAPNDGQLTYDWSIDGVSKTGQKTTETFNEFGQKSIQLTVTGPDGYTDSTSKTIDINDVSITFSVNNPGINVDSSLSLSTSAGGEMDKYYVDWNGDGSFSGPYYNEQISHTFTTTGEREMRVKAIDTDSNSQTTVEKLINIYQSPQFTLSPEATNGYVTKSLTYEATNVVGDGLTYEWDFGNGDTKTGQSVSYTYQDSGQFTVTLTVTNDKGIVKSKSTQVTMEYLDPYQGCKEYSSDTTLSAGTYTYDCLVVSAGTTLTAQGNPSLDGSNSYGGVKIETSGPIVINGTLDAEGQGYQPEDNGPGCPCGQYSSGAGYGGLGGGTYDYSTSGSTYGSATEAKRLGSSSKQAGGGSVWLVSQEKVLVNGHIDSSAEPPGSYGSAASGGSIRIEGPTVDGSGSLDASGGDNADGDYSGGGGGGRILFVTDNKQGSISTDVSGGLGYSGFEGRDGQPGTVETVSWP